jgi:hypothetical protein
LNIEGSVSGSTDVTETLATVGSDIALTGEWGGLTAAGMIHIEVFGRIGFIPKKVSKKFIDGKSLPLESIPLPQLQLTNMLFTYSN